MAARGNDSLPRIGAVEKEWFPAGWYATMGTIRSILLALGLTACSQSGWGACIPPDDGPLAAGTWAGESGYFIVSHPDGSADVHEPCKIGRAHV